MTQLDRERRIRYRQENGLYLKTENDALAFIDDLGFAWLIDLSDADLPSLQRANPGPYPYKSSEDNTRNAAWWWSWKQSLSGRKACYYSKVLRGKGTFISWECFPLLYAVYASGNDYQEDYRLGIVSRDEKRVLDILADNPSISSRDLRSKFAPDGSKNSTKALDKALQSLQESFRVTVAGGILEGWTVHNWALVNDWVHKEILLRAHRIDRNDAMKELILRYLSITIAATPGDIAWVFRWNRRIVSGLLNDLLIDGKIRGTIFKDVDCSMYLLAH